MEQFTEKILKEVPDLHSQDDKGFEADVYIRLDGINGWKWYITEYSEKEQLFFGYVKGFENEWGYISKEELSSLIENGCAYITSTEKTQLKNCI